METLLQDVRYALRLMAKSPGFVAAAVLTLALGIGTNSAIFSIVNGVLLRPLPYPHPEQIVDVWDEQAGHDIVSASSYPEFAWWRAHGQVFQTLAAQFNNSNTLSGLGMPESVPVLRISSNYFPLLGVQPMIGRNFEVGEEALSSARVAIITHSFWQTRFGGDPSVLNRTLTLNDSIFTIIGVLPRDFQALRPGDIYVPLRLSDRTMTNWGLHFITVIGRLRPGLEIAEARRQLIPITEQLRHDPSHTGTAHDPILYGMKEKLTEGSGAPLVLMFSAVGFVLLIGCANIANLLLARAAGRHREMAVRIALGAGRWRLVRQLLTESTLLSLVGGALGLLVARATLTGLLLTLGSSLPRAAEVHMDSSVLLFTLGIALLTGIVFGLAPSRELLRSSLVESLGEGGRGGAGVGGRKRGALVVCEVALAMVLLVGAGLVLRSFARLLSVPKGFDSGHVLTFALNLPQSRYKTPEQQTAFFNAALERFRALPGVEAAGLVNNLPLAGGNVNGGIDIEGHTYPQDSGPVADKRIISTGYFRAMHIPLLRGRDFTDGDVAAAPHVAIINEALAKKYFPNEDSIGKRIDFAWDLAPWQEIVGVIGDVKHDGLDTHDNAEIYVPFMQRPDPGFTVAIRTGMDPDSLVSATRSVVQSLDRGLPISDVFTLDDLVSLSVSDQRSRVILLGALGALALLLSALGIYSVLAYSVAQQTREIGVRMALGAQSSDVLRMVLSKGLRQVFLGVVIGIAASLGLTQLMRSLLFDVKPTDPITFAAVTLLLLAVALVACWIPARRATRVDPLVALRYE